MQFFRTNIVVARVFLQVFSGIFRCYQLLSAIALWARVREWPRARTAGTGRESAVCSFNWKPASLNMPHLWATSHQQRCAHQKWQRTFILRGFLVLMLCYHSSQTETSIWFVLLDQPQAGSQNWISETNVRLTSVLIFFFFRDTFRLGYWFLLTTC